ncbi:MAG: flagellar basal-body rod protein FlgG [Pseudomonadota bacterium]|nr:flagellar basal-body rod protein FlgG [Pseudomonadota bacterium]
MRALYTAATGMTANQIKVENIANNIANNSTTGFKKVRENFEDLVYQSVGGKGASGDAMQLGSGTRLAGLSRDFRNGDTLMSSSPTAMLIDGPGFFVVESPSGETFYTRDGNFRTDAEGNLTTQNGYRVAPGIQIPPGGTLTMGPDGSLGADVPTASGSESVSLGTLELALFPNPEALQAAGGNLFRGTSAAGDVTRASPQEEGAGTVLQYATEGSNVDVAEELIAMITAQRGYELSSKVIQAADEMLQTAAGLRR